LFLTYSIRGADAVFLFYDITSEESITHIEKTKHELQNILGRSNVPFILIGTKIDLPNRRVPKAQAAKLATKLNCGFFSEVSNLTGEGVNETMEKFLSYIIAKYDATHYRVANSRESDTSPLLVPSGSKKQSTHSELCCSCSII